MSAPVELALHDQSVTLGGRIILHPTCLTLCGGQLIALVGPNGAGKSTFLRAVSGLIAATGSATIDRRPIATMPRAERARTIAYLSQGHQIAWPLPARAVVALGRHPHGAQDPDRLSDADHTAVTRAMERTGTLHFADRDVTALSGGEKARVMLARALAVEAPVLLADEPVASLDPRHQLTVMRDLRQEAARGALVIAVLHDLGLAARFADGIVLMTEGKVIATGTPQNVLSPKNLRSAYGITALVETRLGENLVVPWDIVP